MTQIESVLEYFRQHPGEPIAIEVLTVGINRLRKEQGLEPMTDQQIKWTINSLRHRGGANIEIVAPGRAWRLEQEQEPTGSMEDMGYTDDSEPAETEKVWCPEPGVIFRWNLVEHKLYRVTIAEIPL